MLPLLEHIKPLQGTSLVLTKRKEKRFDFAWHRHSEFEITLITSGCGRRFVGDTIADYGPGDFVLVGPNLAHTWASHESDPGPHAAIVAQFAADKLSDWPELTAVRQLLQRAERGLLFTAEAGTPRKCLESAQKAEGLERWLGLLQTLNHLSRIPSSPIASPGWLRQEHGRKVSRHSQQRDARIDTVYQHIERHLLRNIPQNKVADLVGLSPAAFSRFFKRAAGTSYTRYVQELRIGEACRLLSETEMAVTNIALDVGFRSVPHFNRVFKRRRGMPPREWRRAQRGHPSSRT